MVIAVIREDLIRDDVAAQRTYHDKYKTQADARVPLQYTELLTASMSAVKSSNG